MEALFVYGTLKRGFGNHHLLQNAEFLGQAETEDKYELRAAGIPFLRPTSGKTRIRGELYAVDGGTLERVDRLEGHPQVYRRERVPVLAHGYRISAWVYFWPHPAVTYTVLPRGFYGPSFAEIFREITASARSWYHTGDPQEFFLTLRDSFRFGTFAYVEKSLILCRVGTQALKLEVNPETLRVMKMQKVSIKTWPFRANLPIEILRGEGMIFLKRGDRVEPWSMASIHRENPLLLWFFPLEEQKRFNESPTSRDLLEIQEVLSGLGYSAKVPEIEERIEELGGVPVSSEERVSRSISMPQNFFKT